MSESKSGTTVIGTGKSLDPGEGMKIREISIPDEHRARHVMVYGTTGTGKTRLAENVIEQDICAGRSVVFIDPKNDQEIASKILQIAYECNRQEDLMFINTAFPEYSAVIDPLSHWFIPEELVAHCVAGIKEGKEPFYRNVGKEITGAVITGLGLLAKAQNKKRLRVNLNDIKRRMSREELEGLKKEISGISAPETSEISADLARIIDTGQEYYAKVASSLRVALMELTTGNIGRIIGKADQNRFLTRLEEGKTVILVCQLGSLVVQEAAFTLGKVILSMIQSFIGRVYMSNRKKVVPALCLHIDEAQSVLHPGIEDLFSKGGSANCWITAYTQSVNQVFAMLGQDFGKSVLSNTNTKIFLRVPDSDTADYVTTHFGTHKLLSPIFAPGGQITTREIEEDVLKPFDIISLRPREFYMLTYSDAGSSGRFKGRTHNTSVRKIELVYPAAPAQ